MKAKVLIDRQLVLGDMNKFVAKIQVLSVQNSERYPQGINAKFILLNTVEGTPRLLIDNHEPYGFQVHTRLPKEHDHREKLETQGRFEATTILKQGEYVHLLWT